MRSPIRRRSISIWLSPGPPRKPKPPRWRSRWVQDRTSRVRWYSRCASSTCSEPSRVRARSPKISRISPVRSMTLQPQARSRLRCCTGDNAASTTATLICCSAIAAVPMATCPSPSSVAERRSRSGWMAVCRMVSPMDAARPTASASLASAARWTLPSILRLRSWGRMTAARVGPGSPLSLLAVIQF